MTSIWLDCDPGHDDATAIMLALHLPSIELKGISTVHGNASLEHTTLNAARCLEAFAADSSIRVHQGAAEPLLLEAKYDPEIHGLDGLGGVIGLPVGDPARISSQSAVQGMADFFRGSKGTIVACGPLTNIALFISLHPELLQNVTAVVLMGGAVGIGNRGAVSEYNILCDPHAAQIVFNAPVKTVMVPINVTHTAIVTPEIMDGVLNPQSPIRKTLHSLLVFFASSYADTFGFVDGPPLHDALAVAYVALPELFTAKRYRVDVELTGTHSLGETVVDIWNYSESNEDGWGRGSKNCLVVEKLDVSAFFDVFLECVKTCDIATS
ncbi:uridine nucleosidase [Mycena floridula]|nr:uridine nucleosidase [Mycena floridula]